MRFRRSLSLLSLLLLIVALSACSPHYNWREAHGENGAFSVLLPAKPSSYSRPVTLGNTQVSMTMTAAEVDNISFAVGTALLPNAEQAQAALAGMRTALIANINGVPDQTHIPGTVNGAEMTLDAAASGTLRGKPARLAARFAAKGPRIYQILVLGDAKAVTPETLDMFFTSFKAM
ncbi:hypothetical protein QN374_13885 [Herbaspirillum sp. RTI4]|nr:hypothetical protein [Herbaspirillum sp. RTI4]